MARQRRARLTITCLKETGLRQAASKPGEALVPVVAIGMQAGKEFIHGQAGVMHVDTHHRRPILLDTLDVFGLELLFVGRRVSSLQSLGSYVISGDDPPAEQAGPAWLKVIYAAA